MSKCFNEYFAGPIIFFFYLFGIFFFFDFSMHHILVATGHSAFVHSSAFNLVAQLVTLIIMGIIFLVFIK